MAYTKISFGRDVWDFGSTELAPDEKYRVNWRRFLPLRTGTKAERAMLVRASKAYFRRGWCQSDVDGDRYAPTTQMAAFFRLQAIARWMAGQNMWRFQDWTSDDIVAFLQARKARDGSGEKKVARRSLQTWLAMFKELWDLRDAYPTPLAVDPYAVEDDAFEVAATRRNRPWKAIPEDIALAMIRDAISWNERNTSHSGSGL